MTQYNSTPSSGNLSEKVELLVDRMKILAAEIRVKKNDAAGKKLPDQPVERPGRSASLASKIDHTLLKPEATREDIRRICREAREHGFATVCINSSWIPFASEILQGSSVLPIAVVGFPLGASSTASKAFEAQQAVQDGAKEIDMVIALGALKGKEYEIVFDDIAAVVRAAAPYAVKVILETSMLTLEEKVAACVLSKEAGAGFVKTSTGFGGGGATVEDIQLMRRVVGPQMGVKASGGVRTYEDARRMIEAGADRIGASASVAIVTGESGHAAGSY